MGRMKELYMEVYEQHDGQIPEDFDFDAFLAQKIAEREEMETKMRVSEVSEVSSCCGSNMSRLTSEDGPSFSDLGICPDCHEHCGIEEKLKTEI